MVVAMYRAIELKLLTVVAKVRIYEVPKTNFVYMYVRRRFPPHRLW